MGLKRSLYLTHRWTAIAMCVLLAAWFASGIVMLFVGYPKFTPWERLAALPALGGQGCCIEPARALAALPAGTKVARLVLTSVAGRARYEIDDGAGRPWIVDAASGALLPGADAQHAVQAARAFRPGVAATHRGTVFEDRWTHGRGLNRHRPLHVVELGDAAATRVYVSSGTGEIVLDATRAERNWNIVGAWLHWLYMLRNQPADPVWTWAVIALSGIGVVTALTGIANGLLRWRFAGKYKHGGRSPYRERWMRWHHFLGLGGGAIVFTWIFSGLMSMNPGGLFDARGARPDAAALRGGSPATARLALPVAGIVERLRAAGFQPREIEWRLLAGQPFVLARDGGNATRVLVDTADGATVRRMLPDALLRRAAAALLPAPLAAVQLLTRHDAYYYARGSASMYGGNERRLPVLRVVFGDAHATWVHLDPATGAVELSLDRGERTGRWLFNLLHSWDLPAMLDAGWAREAVLILLSSLGLLLSATGIVLGLRRLRRRAAA